MKALLPGMVLRPKWKEEDPNESQDAVRRNPLTKKAQDSEIETVVMLWLRTACDRAAERKERLLKAMKKQQVQQHD
ncbi:UNVERIFIED_CONTAM: hypothetical protein FKN15_040429 [Acipenser sinensis]